MFIFYLFFFDVMILMESEGGCEWLKEFVFGWIVLFGSMIFYEDEYFYLDWFLKGLLVELVEMGEVGCLFVCYVIVGVYVFVDFIGLVLFGRIVVEVLLSILMVLVFVFVLLGVGVGLVLLLLVLFVFVVMGVVVGFGLSYVGFGFGYFLFFGVVLVVCIVGMVVVVVGKVGLL